MSRDLGLNHGAGKGDADRTTNVKKFQENLAEIPLNPHDKTGFKKVSAGRYRKTYGKPAPKPEKLSDEVLSAQRTRSAALGGFSADH